MASKRAKIVLRPMDLHRLLGLPDGVRVIGMRTTVDPEAVHILFEGDDLPPDNGAEEAATGLAEAPWLWHPIQGDRGHAPRLTWGDWKPGDRRPGPASAGAS